MNWFQDFFLNTIAINEQRFVDTSCLSNNGFAAWENVHIIRLIKHGDRTQIGVKINNARQKNHTLSKCKRYFL